MHTLKVLKIVQVVNDYTIQNDSKFLCGPSIYQKDHKIQERPLPTNMVNRVCVWGV